MDRRTFLGTLAGGLLTAPLAAESQAVGRYGGSVSSQSPSPPSPDPSLRTVPSRPSCTVELAGTSSTAWPVPWTSARGS
jgi:hypothetical protein